MNSSTAPAAWSGKEKQQVVVVALSPALVVLLITLGAAAIARANPFLPALFILPFAYLTLFAGVMPALILLRRWHRETRFTFCLAVYLGTVLPWFPVYLALASQRLHTNPVAACRDALLVLSVPGATAALVALCCWQRFFRPRTAEHCLDSQN